MDSSVPKIRYRNFSHENSERDLRLMHEISAIDLSEQYQKWTFKFFSDGYPDLTVFAEDEANNKCVGVVISRCFMPNESPENSIIETNDTVKKAFNLYATANSKNAARISPAVKTMNLAEAWYTIPLEQSKQSYAVGYIGMVGVDPNYKRLGIGKKLAELVIERMRDKYCVEKIEIETEEDNEVALNFYKKLGFISENHQRRYYLNGKGAFKLTKQIRQKFRKIY